MNIKLSDGTVLFVGRYVQIGNNRYKYLGFEDDIDFSNPDLKSLNYCYATPEPKCEVKVKSNKSDEIKLADTWEYYDGENTIAYSKSIVRLYFDVKTLMAYMDSNDTNDLDQWKHLSKKDRTTFDMICGILNAFNTSLKEGDEK